MDIKYATFNYKLPTLLKSCYIVRLAIVPVAYYYITKFYDGEPCSFGSQESWQLGMHRTRIGLNLSQVLLLSVSAFTNMI
jgi:hypothetical protein